MKGRRLAPPELLYYSVLVFHRPALGFRITQRFSLPNDFVDLRGFNWDVRILKAQRISEELWRSYFDTVSVRGQRGDKISPRRTHSLVQLASAHFKAT